MTRNAKNDDVISRLEKWFTQADGHDDFWRCGPADPFTVVGPKGTGGDETFVFAPKGYLILESKRVYREFDGIGLLSRSGVPQAQDVEWIRRVLDGRRMAFLGDMDPVDLLSFVWWRAWLGAEQVEYLGVSDRYLDRLGVEIPDNYTISLSTWEIMALDVLEVVCPEYRDLVGPNGAAILADGRKIELEAVMSALGPPGRLLLPALA